MNSLAERDDAVVWNVLIELKKSELVFMAGELSIVMVPGVLLCEVGESSLPTSGANLRVELTAAVVD